MERHSSAATSGTAGHVLVVDDTAGVRQSIKTALTGAGYDVMEAENDKQAISVMQGMESPFPADVMLCDLQMPQCDGAEMIARFRRLCPTVPVVALAAYQDVELGMSLMRRGVVSNFLVKPVSQEELLSVVKRAVEQKAARSEREVSYRGLKREVAQ